MPLRRLATATALATSLAAAPLAAAEDGVTTFTLENGMDVVVIEDTLSLIHI